MKIYFTASITYREKFKEIYKRIVNKLISLGYEVEATHVLEHQVEQTSSNYKYEQKVKDYEEMLGWINEADIVVCEVSFPSTIVTGHVMTRAMEHGKPVLALCLGNSVPPLLLGLETERFKLIEYNKLNLEKVLERELKELLRLPDERFTLLLPSKITNHLDMVAKKGITRSEYIRSLIKKDIKKNKK